MEIEERLATIGRIPIASLSDGRFETVGDLYDGLLEPLLPAVSVVEQWQNLLYKYVEEPDAVFYLRRYHSDSRGDWANIRRGFITEYEHSSYVCCDNFFTHYIYAMAVSGYVPSYEDFKSCMQYRRFPYGFMSTEQERRIQAVRQGKPPRINSSGWKLAHVVPVNKRYRGYDYAAFADSHFPRGERREWRNEGKGYYSRVVPREMSPQERELLKAHFLRLSSPMNYFLVPKKANETDLLGGDIGEREVLLVHIRFKMAERYGLRELREFFQSVLAEEAEMGTKDNSAVRIGLSCWGSENKAMPIAKRTVNVVRKAAGQKVSKKQLHEMVRLYLEDSLSFRKLEERVLGIASKERGGGFVAKAALNAAGVTAEHKGVLARITPRELLQSSGGVLRKTIEDVYFSGR